MLQPVASSVPVTEPPICAAVRLMPSRKKPVGMQVAKALIWTATVPFGVQLESCAERADAACATVRVERRVRGVPEDVVSAVVGADTRRLSGRHADVERVVRHQPTPIGAEP